MLRFDRTICFLTRAYFKCYLKEFDYNRRLDNWKLLTTVYKRQQKYNSLLVYNRNNSSKH